MIICFLRICFNPPALRSFQNKFTFYNKQAWFLTVFSPKVTFRMSRVLTWQERQPVVTSYWLLVAAATCVAHGQRNLGGRGQFCHWKPCIQHTSLGNCTAWTSDWLVVLCGVKHMPASVWHQGLKLGIAGLNWLTGLRILGWHVAQRGAGLYTLGSLQSKHAKSTMSKLQPLHHLLEALRLVSRVFQSSLGLTAAWERCQYSNDALVLSEELFSVTFSFN